MAILNNQFTCSNGHSFEANAKIRARCPECGVTARRKFETALPKPPEIKPEPTHKAPTVLKPILLKQGRPRVMPARKTTASRKPAVKPSRKTPVVSAIKGKVAGGLVKSKRITTKGVMPTIRQRPIKTAPARTIKGEGSPRSSKRFADEVFEKFRIF